MLIILSAISLFGAYDASGKHDWGLLKAIPFLWLLYAPMVYIGTRYRILWQNDQIRQIALGKPDVTLSMREIAVVSLEVNTTGGRPFRRIALYSHHSKSGNVIDVSLKHFAAEDIRVLMRSIHQQRPDLALPKHWI
jgi:hypothetical protein